MENDVEVLENRIIVGRIEFIKIPSGKFIMGCKDDNPLASDIEKPQHTLELPDFWMAKFPLTNEQYAIWIGKDKHPVEGREKKKHHPAVYVMWDNAIAFCKWFNATFAEELMKKNFILSLPNEAQWEKAARGHYGNEWPWGNEWDRSKCNNYESFIGGTTQVGRFSPQGDSPYGCADMVGNVWEWIYTIWGKNILHPDFMYPYDFSDGREAEINNVSHVLRGRSFHRKFDVVRNTCKRTYNPENLLDATGFRVCLSQTS